MLARAFFLLFFLLFPAVAWAYIDPGTGATFIGSLAPLLLGLCSAVVALFLKIFWNPITGFFRKLTGKSAAEQDSE